MMVELKLCGELVGRGTFVMMGDAGWDLGLSNGR